MDFSTELEFATKLAVSVSPTLVAAAERSWTSKAQLEHEVDEVLGAAIGKAIEARFPEDGILTEEGACRRSRNGRAWVIDPQDGTGDFFHGNHRETSISIALVDGDAPVLGVVYLPNVPLVAERELRELLGGAPLLVSWAKGASVARNGELVKPRPATGLTKESLVLVSRNARGGALTKNEQALAPARLLPCASIATRLALAAIGVADVGYTIRNALSPWDFAGGQALCVGAGGDVVDPSAEPIAWRAGECLGAGRQGYFGSRSLALAREAADRLASAFPEIGPPRREPAPRERDPLPTELRARLVAAGGKVVPDNQGLGRTVVKVPRREEALAREIERETRCERREGTVYTVLLLEGSPASPVAAPPPPPPAPPASPPSYLDFLARDLFGTRAALLDRHGRPGVGALGAKLARIEAEVAADPARCFPVDARGHARLVTREGTFDAGRFEVLSIAELRSRVGSTKKSGGRKARLSVVAGADPLTDVGALQGAASDDALFQVASQFNGLEAPSACVVPVADYVHDNTQGPRASVSAFPGTFLRHYRAPSSSGPFVQTEEVHVDFLEAALPPSIGRTRCGYLIGDHLANPGKLASTLESNLEKIRVGVHDGVEVVHGHDWDGPVRSPHPRIAQVFTSTAAVGYSSRREEVLAACRPLLRAAYLGTLLAALALGKRTAVLTLIGGGVFANPHREIWDAIAWACDEAEAVAPTGIDVVVNARELPKGDDHLVAVQKRGGTFVRIEESLVTIQR